MQIKELITERRQQQTLIVYHGTSSHFKRTILKQGLLANPPKRTYDVSNPDADVGADSEWEVATYGGIYVTTDPAYAKGAAHVTVDKLRETVPASDNQIMMLTIQYVLGSAGIDEDFVLETLENSVIAFQQQLLTATQPTNQLVNAMSSQFMKLFQKENFGTMAQYMPQILAQYFTSLIQVLATMQADQRAEFLDEFMANNNRNANLKAATIKIMDNISGNYKDMPTNFRIDRNVGFKGKTRILQMSVGKEVLYQAPDYAVATKNSTKMNYD